MRGAEYDSAQVEAAHKLGMERIYKHMERGPEEFQSANGRPNSFYDLVNDFHRCRDV